MCGSVAEWLGCWTCDQQVTGSNPSLSTVECNPGKVVNIHVPLSPSSIIWYQQMGSDWCLVAGKVTVGLASYWQCITDISGSPTSGSRPRRGRWAPAYALLWTMVNFTFLVIIRVVRKNYHLKIASCNVRTLLQKGKLENVSMRWLGYEYMSWE